MGGGDGDHLWCAQLFDFYVNGVFPRDQAFVIVVASPFILALDPDCRLFSVQAFSRCNSALLIVLCVTALWNLLRFEDVSLSWHKLYPMVCA